jgi:hypothetical protein
MARINLTYICLAPARLGDAEAESLLDYTHCHVQSTVDTTEVALQQGMTLIPADTINQQRGKVPLKQYVHISLESQGRRNIDKKQVNR